MSLFRKEKLADPQLSFDDASLLASTATAGSATLPNAPTGFIVVKVSGTQVKIPYYSV